MSERLQFMGRREELDVERKRMEIRIEGLVTNLRNALNPLAKPEELPTDRIVEWSLDLAEARDRYTAVLQDLKKIHDILGR
jgi:hypothetical protein